MKTTINYFENCQTAEDVKKLYHQLAAKNHPDNGGDEETMKEINIQFDIAFKKLRNVHKKATGETWTAEEGSKAESHETPEQFRDMITELHKYNVTIEIIGCFVWVSGDTRPMKEELKKWGFHWHSSKKMWYHKPENYHKRGGKEFTMDEIRATYTTYGTIHGGQQSRQDENKEEARQPFGRRDFLPAAT